MFRHGKHKNLRQLQARAWYWSRSNKSYQRCYRYEGFCSFGKDNVFLLQEVPSGLFRYEWFAKCVWTHPIISSGCFFTINLIWRPAIFLINLFKSLLVFSAVVTIYSSSKVSSWPENPGNTRLLFLQTSRFDTLFFYQFLEDISWNYLYSPWKQKNIVHAKYSIFGRNKLKA